MPRSSFAGRENLDYKLEAQRANGAQRQETSLAEILMTADEYKNFNDYNKKINLTILNGEGAFIFPDSIKKIVQSFTNPHLKNDPQKEQILAMFIKYGIVTLEANGHVKVLKDLDQGGIVINRQSTKPPLQEALQHEREHHANFMAPGRAEKIVENFSEPLKVAAFINISERGTYRLGNSFNENNPTFISEASAYYNSKWKNQVTPGREISTLTAEGALNEVVNILKATSDLEALSHKAVLKKETIDGKEYNIGFIVVRYKDASHVYSVVAPSAAGNSELLKSARLMDRQVGVERRIKVGSSEFAYHILNDGFRKLGTD